MVADERDGRAAVRTLEVHQHPADHGLWTYRKTTLYRYRSSRRRHPVPVLLTFALINRPDIVDLRPGNSFVEFLLDEGYDVFLVDWGDADEEDAETGLDDFALEHTPRAVREVRRASGAEEITLIGWCIGAVLTGMYLSVTLDAPVRNWIPLTMPFDAANTTCESLLGNDEVDTDWLGQYGDSCRAPPWTPSTSCSSRCRTTSARPCGCSGRCRTARRTGAATSPWPGGWRTPRTSRCAPSSSG